VALRRVLVVDDDADLRQSVRMTLAKAGYEVIVAEDGEKGIAAIRSGDNPSKVDLVACDLYMPKVGGVEAITYFRSHLPSVPVIAMTGSQDISSAEYLFKQGIVEFILKPFGPSELLAAVEKALPSR
jgi:DNA-binding NtrC family response regulator